LRSLSRLIEREWTEARHSLRDSLADGMTWAEIESCGFDPRRLCPHRKLDSSTKDSEADTTRKCSEKFAYPGKAHPCVLLPTPLSGVQPQVKERVGEPRNASKWAVGGMREFLRVALSASAGAPRCAQILGSRNFISGTSGKKRPFGICQ
jgi:hypothetical protein